MAAGASAAVIYNNTGGNFSGTLQSNSGWIPTVSISQADGLALQAVLPAVLTIVNQTDPSNVYRYLNGTSMATPHVVGAVAFAAHNFPNETVPQRIQRILANVDPVASLAGKVRTGGRLNLQRIVDTDLNGLPDWWEETYFGQLTGTAPDGDADHDGLSNLAEWIAGTNPTNAASGLWLTAKVAGNLSSISLSWPSVAGKAYRLERATNLVVGFDSVMFTNIAAEVPTNTLTDINLLPGNVGFYRVGVEQ
jgi:subtilisin family serine protease